VVSATILAQAPQPGAQPAAQEEPDHLPIESVARVAYPDLKVVALSDAVTVGATGPLIDYPGGGSALEWQQVLP
jgi:hypothetical protein